MRPQPNCPLSKTKVVGLEASLREARLSGEWERSHADATTRARTDDPEGQLEKQGTETEKEMGDGKLSHRVLKQRGRG